MTDKPLLDRLCADVQPRVSELSFAALYLFREAHGYRLATAAGSIIVLGRGYDGSAYFLPPLGGDVAVALKIMFSNGQALYGADELFVTRYLTESTLQITELRDSHDYLYLREELATLPGSRFHKKKNHINYFSKRHNYTVSRFSREHLGGCLNVLNKWKDSSMSEERNSRLMEVEAAAEALYSSYALGLEGVVVVVNNNVVAFALGERLNRKTAVCHFEKADPFMEGLNQLINREFARLLFQDCQYVNREQDLGNMGLRNAKLSYHPVELVEKYLCHMPQP
jgi:hypothetical protein